MAQHSGLRLLNSWKEVAGYLGRGVRTVQRWERLGLPVRRLGPGLRSPVLADARDLDRWLLTAARVKRIDCHDPSAHLIIHEQLGRVVERSHRLCTEMVELRQSHWASVLRLTETLSALEKTLSSHSGQSEVIHLVSGEAHLPRTRVVALAGARHRNDAAGSPEDES